jgi:hypothetical protein
MIIESNRIRGAAHQDEKENPFITTRAAKKKSNHHITTRTQHKKLRNIQI